MQAETTKFPFPKFNASKNEPEYTIVKYLAVHQLGLQIFHSLEMLHESSLAVIFCDQSEEALADIQEVEQIKTITPDVKRIAHVSSNVVVPDVALQDKVFNWSLKDCLQRLTTDIVWINIMKVQWSPKCLELKKLNTDFKELYRFLRLILRGYLERQNGFKNIFKLLWDTQVYNNILNDFSEELTRNQARFHNQNQTKFSMNLTSRTSTKMNFQLRVGSLNPTEANILADAEFRYQMNFYESQVYQAEKRSECDKSIMDQKIYDVLNKNERESKTFVTTATAYEQQIEDLRDRIYTMNSIYDIDFREASERVAAVQLRIKNLELRRQFLQEQQLRFREELETYRLALLDRQRLDDEEEDRKKLLQKQKAELKAAKLKNKQQRKIDKMARQLRKATRVSESDLEHPKRKKQKTLAVQPRLDSITDLPVGPSEQQKKKKKKS